MNCAYQHAVHSGKTRSIRRVFFDHRVQHNPPPLIAFMLRTPTEKLRPGGVGYLQVPTHTIGYRFDAERYLANGQAPGVPEMLVIPQTVLLRIIEDAGCQLLDAGGRRGRFPFDFQSSASSADLSD